MPPLLALGLLVATGCRTVPAPYSADAPPSHDALMGTTTPRLEALQVPRAKIRQGGLSANLLYVVQSPERFAGTIQVAGNELVSLAVNERRYGLRKIADAGAPPGYYEGPPSACAVEALVGVPLEPTELVALLLGGSPVLAGTSVTEQRWDKRAPGREVLRLEGPDRAQELRFAWVSGGWVFAGTTVWRGPAEDRDWAFTIAHESFHRVQGHVLPDKTILRTPPPPGARRKKSVELTIRYLEQVPDPPSLIHEDPRNGETPPPDVWEDDWDDDEGWEDGETGAPPPDEPPAAPPSTPAKVLEIPRPFRVNGAGLPARGDLCR